MAKKVAKVEEKCTPPGADPGICVRVAVPSPPFPSLSFPLLSSLLSLPLSFPLEVGPLKPARAPNEFDAL